MRYHLIINAQAGSVLGRTADEIATAVAEPLRRAGHAVETTCLGPGELGRGIAAAIATRPDAIVVGGGDGSVRTVGAALIGTGIAMGVIPLGTFNVLAQAIDMPLDLAKAADALVTARPEPMDAAEVNGRIFLCNSVMGIPLMMTEERARLRGEPLHARVAGYARGIYDVMRSTKRIEIEIDHGPQKRRVRALTVLVTNNPYADDKGLTLKRRALAGGQLGMYISQHASGGALFWQLFRRGIGMSSDDPNAQSLTARELVISTSRPHVRVSNDGEMERLSTPLIYRIRPQALQILRPVGTES